MIRRPRRSTLFPYTPLSRSLNDSRQVSERTASALACLPRRGVKVVLASARPPRSVRHVYRSLKLDTLQINYNGAMIWNEAESDRKSTRLNSSHLVISYAVFC